MNLARAAYIEWKKLRDIEVGPDDEPTDETAEKDNSMNLDLLESDAREGIKRYIVSKKPLRVSRLSGSIASCYGLSHSFCRSKRKRRRH